MMHVKDLLAALARSRRLQSGRYEKTLPDAH